MKNSYKFFSIILSLLLLTSMVGLNFYAEDKNFSTLAEDKELYADVKVSLTDDFEEYANEVSELTRNQRKDKNFDIENAVENEYYSSRVVVQSDDVKNIDFSVYEPEAIVFDDVGKVAVLQFDSEEKAKNCVEEVSQLDSVNFAQPDKYYKLDDEKSETKVVRASANDYLSWGTQYIHADTFATALYNRGYTSQVVVAVVDTGVDIDHPFLKNRVLSGGCDFIDSDDYPDDENGHGSHVSGTIVDCTKNLNVKILPVRVIDYDGYGSEVDTANGIYYAATHGADVINLSLGGTHDDLQDYYIKAAVKSGVAVCVAAGNENENTSSCCPAHMTEPIVVAAIDKYSQRADFSNYGSSVDVSAPGVHIYSTSYYGQYDTLSGTSMATPHVSACAAMLKLVHPDASAEEIEQMLKDCCTDLGNYGFDIAYGYGAVNLNNIKIDSHNPGNWEVVTNPTCKDPGLQVRKCIDCGEIVERAEIPVTDDHKYVDTLIAPTCTCVGYIKHTCSVCGKIYTDNETPKIPHTPENYVVLTEPDCYNEGLRQYTCAVCKDVFSEKMDKLEHIFAENVVSSTCTEEGYTVHTCTLCNYSYNTDETPAKGHTEGEWVTISESTCKVQGEMLLKCKDCEITLNKKYLPLKTDHNYQDTVFEPSCTAGGYTIHICKDCSKQIIDSFTLPAGHTPGEWEITVPPTTEQAGSAVQKCTKCLKVLDSKTLPKYKVEKKSNTGVVINDDNKFIYGLKEGFTSIDEFLNGTNCSLIINPTPAGTGTGATVDVLLNKTVLDSYSIVIFGDLSGDGIISEEDFAIIDLYNSFAMDIDENSPYYLAGDLTGDGSINEEDLVIIDLVNSWALEINQEKPY